MKSLNLLTVLVLSVVAASSAAANWFSNPRLGINRHIATAPNPTPEDVLSGRQPMLVKDADGNVIAMIDGSTGKVVATAEPPAPARASAKPAQPETRAR